DGLLSGQAFQYQSRETFPSSSPAAKPADLGRRLQQGRGTACSALRRWLYRTVKPWDVRKVSLRGQSSRQGSCARPRDRRGSVVDHLGRSRSYFRRVRPEPALLVQRLLTMVRGQRYEPVAPS